MVDSVGSPVADLPPTPPYTPLEPLSASTDPTRIPLPLEDGPTDIDTLDGKDATPALIALPPSPPSAKQSLPFRRPRLSNPAIHRISSESGGRRTSGGGRRVSGALQYALQRDREVSDASSLDLAYYEQMREQVIDGEEADRPTWDSSLGFGGAMPHDDGDGFGEAGMAESEEEAWMGCVRQQLNTLFPDLVPSHAGTPELEESGEGNYDVSVSTIATSELPTPPIGLGHSSLPFGYSSPGMPNVREEIGGLRDEIERLRGVVSGLAQDMRGSASATTEAVVVTSDRTATDGGGGGFAARPQEDTPSDANGLMRDIIRDLDIKINGARTGGTDIDSDVFTIANLLRIRERVNSLEL